MQESTGCEIWGMGASSVGAIVLPHVLPRPHLLPSRQLNEIAVFYILVSFKPSCSDDCPRLHSDTKSC